MASCCNQYETLLYDCVGLDLTDEKGFICGEILSVLGAEIIKVEPPRGQRSRNIGPYWHDEADPEKSLYWFAYNRGKRGITLNLETADGQEIFKRLVKESDIVIESFLPGHMDSLGLGYEVLQKVNPKLVMTAISPFGQTGPYKDYKASDIVVMALGGRLFIEGDPDYPPANISLPQSYLMAGAQAAIATMIAYYHSELSGQGQYCDVSAQQSAAWYLGNIIPLFELEQKVIKRAGAFRVGLSGGVSQRQVWRCKDGFVSFIIIGGQAAKGSRLSFVKWIKDEGMATEAFLNIDWDTYDMNALTQELIERIEKTIGEFFLTKTKAELHQKALEKNILLYPISAPNDLIDYHQLVARDYWTNIEHPELGAKITYPGSFFKSSVTSGVVKRRAPLIGEHNSEIYRNRLGLSDEDIARLKGSEII